LGLFADGVMVKKYRERPIKVDAFNLARVILIFVSILPCVHFVASFETGPVVPQ
jgi:hypothetical protein